MRKIVALALVTSMVLGATGCGKDTEGKIKLAEYKGLEKYESDMAVTSDLDSQIESMLQSKAETEEKKDGKVEKENNVNIDYIGSVKLDDGYYDMPEGSGSAKGANLDLDKNTMVEGFADELIGKKVGDTVEFTIKYPSTAKEKTTDKDGKEIELAGKKVKYKVTINSRTVITVPELTDEFVKKNFSSFAKTVKEYKDYMKRELQVSKFGGYVWNDFIEACEVEEYPSKELESYQTVLNDNYEQQLNSQYNADVDTYLEACGATEDDWDNNILEKAQNKIKYDMIISEILKAEGMDEIKPNSKAYKKAAKKLAESYNTSVEMLEAYYGGAEGIASILNEMQIQAFMFDNAKTVDGDRPEDKEE